MSDGEMAAKARALYNYDPATGSLTQKKNRGYARAGKEVADRARIDGEALQRTHVIFLMMTGALPTGRILHKDGDASNDRWSNLMLDVNTGHADSRAQSVQARAPRNDRGYLAVLRGQGVVRCLGTYGSAKDAVAARQEELAKMGSAGVFR